jgi:hypothetical protein
VGEYIPAGHLLSEVGEYIPAGHLLSASPFTHWTVNHVPQIHNARCGLTS